MSNEMKRPVNWVILILLVIGTVWVVSHDGQRPLEATWHTNQGRVFGTVYKITYRHTADIQPLIEARLQEVDNSLSPFNEQSVISRINRGESMATDSLFRIVWRKAVEVYRLSSGAFDITCAPLINAWGFGFRESSSVTPEAIDSLLQFVGMDKVRLDADGHVWKADPRTMFDCSAIAKGFGSDCVGALFDSLSISDYMVEIGGEVVTRGTNAKGTSWRIGISKPVEDSLAVSQQLDTIVALSGEGMATSGNYRNFYYKNGRRYAHTVDPRLGVPVQHSVLSATVIAPTCMEADALATAFMVIGPDSARTIVEARDDLRAYLICDTDHGMAAIRLGKWTE